jgi:hypothetical protein
MASIISTKTSGGGGIAVTGDTSGVLELQSNNGTTAVTIDASQNVGIGTATPAVKFHVNGNANTNSGIFLQNQNTNIGVFSTEATWLGTGSSNNLVVSSYGSNSLLFGVAGSEQGRFDTSGNFRFNSGYGSVATAYGCRAWVNFNGTGTVAIRGSGNVTSITDNGTGNYRVNLSITLPDINYAVVDSLGGDTGIVSDSIGGAYSYTTTNFLVNTRGGNNAQADRAIVSCAVFR